MAKITAKSPAPKKAPAIHSTITTAQLAELEANRASFNDRFEEMAKRLDVVEGELGLESNPTETPEEGKGAGKKPCGCKQKAITAYAEALLWGVVIGTLITSILFIRQAHRQRYYLGE